MGRTSRSAAGLLAGLAVFPTLLICRDKCGSRRTRADREVRPTTKSNLSLWAGADVFTASDGAVGDRVNSLSMSGTTEVCGEGLKVPESNVPIFRP